MDIIVESIVFCEQHATRHEVLVFEVTRVARCDRVSGLYEHTVIDVDDVFDDMLYEFPMEQSWTPYRVMTVDVAYWPRLHVTLRGDKSLFVELCNDQWHSEPIDPTELIIRVITSRSVDDAQQL